LEEEIYMPQAGGSAAIYGILYQILANLWRASEIRLEAKLAGQEILSARLILEPKGGGDARYEGEGIRVVEQYKTRSGNRTWSLKDLIEDVIPNLFVDLDHRRPAGTSHTLSGFQLSNRLVQLIDYIAGLLSADRTHGYHSPSATPVRS
jgi:hypothetical protein